MRRHNHRLLIAYDGSHYGGWQRQPNAPTIQQLIEEALATITRETLSVTGSGRTDAGVHALGQVAHFTASTPLDCRRLRASLNGLLPQDIRILEATHASDSFHARYSTKRKCYHYHICLAPVQLPFQRLYSWHCRQHLDIDALKVAAQQCVGTHDFTSFANEATSGSAAHDPIRTLYRCDVVTEEMGLRLELEANGFLYKMVRNIVGTLYEVAIHKRTPHAIVPILAARDRTAAGRAAPPQGLFLARVVY